MIMPDGGGEMVKSIPAGVGIPNSFLTKRGSVMT